jgi:hypothetical protein
VDIGDCDFYTWESRTVRLFLLQRTSLHESDNAVDGRIPNRIKTRSLALKTSKAKDGWRPFFTAFRNVLSLRLCGVGFFGKLD